ncbi:MAG: pantetheine-phosphate adenylyltransferase [Ruminococcaceae bacterium]|nr:pantetheine-phosphate adenylyltransferase [Oscillospiraceae bacterium]
MSLAIIPGSFDPMTLGHLDVVLRALEDYDEVVVAVMVNPQKRTLFDMKTRVEIAKRTVEGLSNVRVISDTGMLVELFDRLGADAVCKGYRNQTDYDYEMSMARWNREHNPRFRTVLYPARQEHESLSSTQVRALLEQGRLPEGLVHPEAVELICGGEHEPL